MCMTQPRLASPHTSCRLNHRSTSVSFPLHHLHPTLPSCLRLPPPLVISMTSGLQGDSRSRGQQKSVPTSDSAALKNKRRPGRPRKHPLPSSVSSPAHLSATPSMSSPEILPGHSHVRDEREVGGRTEERLPERDRGGGDTAQQVTESELQAKRKRGRKRKHSDSPCHQR